METCQNQLFSFSTKCSPTLSMINLTLNSDCGDHIDLDSVLQAFEFYELLEAHENLYLYVIRYLSDESHRCLPSCSAVTGVNIKALADLISSLVHPDGKEGKENTSKKKKKICCF